MKHRALVFLLEVSLYMLAGSSVAFMVSYTLWFNHTYIYTWNPSENPPPIPNTSKYVDEEISIPTPFNRAEIHVAEYHGLQVILFIPGSNATLVLRSGETLKLVDCEGLIYMRIIVSNPLPPADIVVVKTGLSTAYEDIAVLLLAFSLLLSAIMWNRW